MGVGISRRKSKLKSINKELIRKELSRAVPGLITLLDLYAERRYGTSFIDLLLGDTGLAHEVIIRALGHDDLLLRTMLRVITPATSKKLIDEDISKE